MPPRNDLVTENIGLVHSCCHRFSGRGIEYDDLFQVGCIGLIKAADRFDETLGFKFSTYAVPVVMGEIKRLFRDTGPVKVSRSIKETALKVRTAKTVLENDMDREPTITEIAAFMGLTPEVVAEAVCASVVPESLTYVTDSDSVKEADLAVPDETEQISSRVMIESVLNDLNEIDRFIIKARYFEQKTQSQIAKELSMTQVQVSRREKKLLAHIRKKLT